MKRTILILCLVAGGFTSNGCALAQAHTVTINMRDLRTQIMALETQLRDGKWGGDEIPVLGPTSG